MKNQIYPLQYTILLTHLYKIVFRPLEEMNKLLDICFWWNLWKTQAKVVMLF